MVDSEPVVEVYCGYRFIVFVGVIWVEVYCGWRCTLGGGVQSLEKVYCACTYCSEDSEGEEAGLDIIPVE